MKKRFITKLMASVLVGSIAIMGAACSKDEKSSKDKKDKDKEKVEETVEETEEAEETAAETTPAPTEAFFTDAEITGVLDPALLEASWNDSDEGTVDATTTIATYTNVSEIKMTFDWDYDSLDECHYEVAVNDEVVYTSGTGYYGFIKLNEVEGIPVNDVAFLPSGTYTVTFYNNGEKVIVMAATVIFDEETADIPSIITRNHTSYTFGCYHYSSSEFTNMVDGNYVNYEAGDEGFFIIVSAPMTGENGTYNIDLSRDGKVINSQEISYEGYENAYVNVELPVEGGLQAGTYEINYSLDGELFGTDIITVK